MNARDEWSRKHTTRVVVKLNHNTDSDIIRYLDGKNRMGIIKAAVREYMNNHRAEEE